MKKTFIVALIALLIAVPLVGKLSELKDPFTPTTKVSGVSISSFYNQRIIWSECYGSFKCGAFQVPIDYSNLKLGKFSIGVLKHDAPNAIGNLVVNPGGPGGSGINYAYGYADAFTPAINAKFNIVGFDPRGVGKSAPIKCLSDKETDQLYSENSYPTTDSEIAKFKADSAAFAKSCQSKNKFLKYYSTANAARDMDILRALLGDNKLNFLGKSYGTYLGTLYAQLFPNNVGKFILDGAVDPTINSMDQTLQQAISFDSAFNAFAEDCMKSSCVFKSDAASELESKLTELNKNPLDVGGRKLTESLAVYGIAFGLYDKQYGWPELRSALTQLWSGNGKPLIQMADAYTGRDSKGNYTNNEADALTIISCDDVPPSDVSADTVAQFEKAAPLFGKYVAYSDLNCTYLPHQEYVKVKSSIATKNSVLVIGTTNDPATPYKWAVKLAQVLTNSKLISLNSDGHTGYNRGSSCVDQAVEKYLISGEIPAQNLACSA